MARSTNPRRNAPAAASTTTPELDATPEMEEPTPATDTDTDVTTPEPEPELEEPATPDAPAEPEPDAAPVTEDAPEPDADSAPEGEDNAATPVRQSVYTDFLAMAQSPTPTVPQDTRNSAMARGCILAFDTLLAQVASLPDDQPVYADPLVLRLSGANGRGVAAAKATLAVARALCLAGWYTGSTHDSVKIRRPMEVTVIVPRLFRPVAEEIFAALNADTGPVSFRERVVRATQVAARKAGRYPNETEYSVVNVPSRLAMRETGALIAAQVESAFPADHPSTTEIRRILSAVAAEYARTNPGKNIVGPTDRFTLISPAVAPEMVTANA